MLRQLGGPIHLDRQAEPIAEHRSQHVAGDRRPAHPAVHDAPHVGQIGEGDGAGAVRVTLAAVGSELADHRQHPAGVVFLNGPEVVQVDRHPLVPPGFSASSTSITGIPSRTGYR